MPKQLSAPGKPDDDAGGNPGQLIIYFFRAYPRRTVALLALLVLAGISESAGIAALLPLLGLASGESGAIGGALGDGLNGVFDAIGITPALGPLLFIIVIGILGKASLTLLAMWHSGYAVAGIAADLRLGLIRSLLRARWSHFISRPVGGLANSVSAEAIRASSTYTSTTRMFAESAQALIYATLALFVSWKVTIAGLVLGAVMFIVLRGLFRAVRETGRAQTRILKQLVTQMTDMVVSLKALKAMGRDDAVGPILEVQTGDLNKVQRRETFYIAAMASAHEPMLAVFLAGGLYVAMTSLDVSLAELIFMAVLLQRIVTRFAVVQKNYQFLASQEAAFWSIRKAIGQAEEEEESVGGELDPHFDREIRVEGVDFFFGDKQVLDKVSIKVPKGSFVAITGPSGAGTTTISDLLVGLIHPRAGTIIVDDTPLDDFNLNRWRRRVGYVPQELLLLHDTIAANIRLGEETVTDQQIEGALRQAEAWSFVCALPEGINTIVGERGGKLSGGQRQRISMARALVLKPWLMVLDEATSALDPETEKSIASTLKNLAGNITIIAVSHQQALVDAADLVYLIEAGVARVPGEQKHVDIAE